MSVKNIRRLALAASFAAAATLSFSANAALVGGAPNWIQSLRVESGLVYISVDYPLGGQCANRVWVDPTTAVGKATYAAAMVAFSIPKGVRIRAYEESAKQNGACQLFDLEVSN